MVDREVEQKELNCLHKQRGAYKRKVTEFGKLTDSLEEKHTNNTITDEEIIELRSRLNNIQSVLEQVEILQSKIYMLTISNEDDEGEYITKFEKEYFAKEAKAKRILGLTESKNSNIDDVNHPGDSGSVISEVTSVRSSQSGSDNSHLKLPTISLPKFDGNYTNWVEFHDIYLSMIHNNEGLSNVQKFHYLKASLEKNASEIIKSLTVTSANYEIAWDLICSRFTNNKLLVQNHIRELFNLPQVTKESAFQLRALIDITTKHLRALESLQQPTNHWDTFIIFLVSSKFDKATTCDWEKYKYENELPTLNELKTFLNERADMLDNINSKLIEHKSMHKTTGSNVYQKPQRAFVATNITCYLCKGSHGLYNCEKFLKLSVQDRINNIKQLNLCLNCFRNTHLVENCDSKTRGCKKCGKKHNTLLHLEKTFNNSTSQSNSEPTSSNSNQINKTFASQSITNFDEVLLATAIIHIKDNHGNFKECRAVLDSASQNHFITNHFATKLGLKVVKINKTSVQGITPGTMALSEKCSVKIKSRVTFFTQDINCLVINTISELFPSSFIDPTLLNLPANLEMADPHWNMSNKVDMLIGAQLFWSLLVQGQIKLGDNLPILQNTQFGWIISGPINFNHGRNSLCFLTNPSIIQDRLQQFWEMEECPKVPALSQEQKLAEEHYKNTTYQDETGRFVVSVPFKNSQDSLGESYNIAKKRFFSLENRMENNPLLKEKYVQFIHEYQDLGHMKKVDNPNMDITHCYLPHHGVINESSTTTKLRVVFDGSCQTSNGVSLNSIQMVGPPVQDLLFNILLRFRQHTIAFTADVQKMYRQVKINSNDTRFQRILWRDDKIQPIETYELQTVTDGTASAPYLATKCLVQIAENLMDQFTEACKIIKSDFYVDDILSGAETEPEAIQLCQQVLHILNSIQFPLHKWISNNPNVMRQFNPKSDVETQVQIGHGEMTRTLGIFWSPGSDKLKYKINQPTYKVITKRSILSEISQVFDPLGLLSPCTIIGKTILQKLWKLNVGWDDELPESICHEWSTLRYDLLKLNLLEIPRHCLCSNPKRVEIHCFSDASEIAYATCIYIRSTDSHGNNFVNLLCSKTKVAPIKQVSIPRLELCAAHLSCKLMNIVRSALRIKIDHIFMWSDSTIVLSWIKLSPNTLKVFVSHRVSEIQTECKDATWSYVPTKENPADLASRGVSPNFLIQSQLWWKGPTWLKENSKVWPSRNSIEYADTLPELKRVETILTSIKQKSLIDFTRFSQYNRLLHSIAYIFRFIHNLKNLNNKTFGPLTVTEIEMAEHYLIKTIQSEVWKTEIDCLQNNKPIHKSTLPITLAPFMDKSGIIRVGGRIQKSELEFTQKHPILLPKHHVTTLLFRYTHLHFGHAGPQQLIYLIRERYWPLNARNYARLSVHRCVRCFKCNPKNTIPQMGILPLERVQVSFPFEKVGVDYAGPFLLKDRKGRGCKTTKCYVALYICLCTKAVHIELVSSLSTEAFLASLNRFIARRGKPTHIFSDNGSNFVGTNNELNKLFDLIKENEKEIIQSLSLERIQWSFIPPRAPNFGGLWEAAVKSMKYHLKRIVGNSIFTIEQYSTLLCQVEGILNSRPLTPMSVHPTDLEPLSPAHFLLGRCITSYPEPSLLHLPTNRLSEFERIQQMIQTLWKRWKSEYLNNLQQRKKWCTEKSNLNVGTMVLLQDDNAPPLCWPVGRIKDVFPGQDNQIRVVDVLTKKGVFTRAVNKLYPLPICDEE